MNDEKEKLLFEARETYAAAENLYENSNRNYITSQELNEIMEKKLDEIKELLLHISKLQESFDHYMARSQSMIKEADALSRTARRLERKAGRLR